MIFPQEAIRARLLSGGSVNPLIFGRLYPFKAPQNVVRPYGVYRRITGNPERHMGGAAAIASCRLQFDWVADRYDVAQLLADAARMRLDGFRGEVPVGTSTLHISHCSLETELDDSVEPQAGSDAAIYRVIQDWRVAYSIPIPA